MARTPSKMLPLGTKAPSFTLPDTDGKTVKDSDFHQRPLLVMFICNHCPFVIHIREGLAKLGQDFSESSLGIVAINSNDAKSYPQDSPEKMKEEKRSAGYRFPYLYDESQEVAKAFDAACTPDFFLFDDQHRLVYRGQFDDSRPGNGVAVTGKDLRAAVEAVLKGTEVSPQQKPSLGCNIKWKENS